MRRFQFYCPPHEGCLIITALLLPAHRQKPSRPTSSSRKIHRNKYISDKIQLPAGRHFFGATTNLKLEQQCAAGGPIFPRPYRRRHPPNARTTAQARCP